MPYLGHFALTAQPFGLTPNTEQYFPTAANGHILQSLQYAAQERGGILKVSGDVGTGKTMLCRLLLRSLMDDPRTAGGVAYLNAPQADGEWLLAALCMEFGLDAKGSRAELMYRLNAFLLDAHAQGRTCVVVVDEAQALGAEGLETIRLLSNLETEQAKLLQIVLFGQPELDDLLARPDLRQVNQRIVFAFQTQPLSHAEVSAYVQHRLHCVRVPGVGFPVFTTGALDLLAQASGGVPRVVNILAEKALLIAFGEDAVPVTEEHVKQAINDSRDICQPVSTRRARLGSSMGQRSWTRRLLWGVVGLEAAALIAVLLLNPEMPARAWGMFRDFALPQHSIEPASAVSRPGAVEAETAVPSVAPVTAASHSVLEAIEAEAAQSVRPSTLDSMANQATGAEPDTEPHVETAASVPATGAVVRSRQSDTALMVSDPPRPIDKPGPPTRAESVAASDIPSPAVDGEGSVARITEDGRWTWE